jgi:hypothetical protein
VKKTNSQWYEDYLQSVPKWKRDLGLVSTEEWLTMPKWKKALGWVFFITVPFIASIESVNF